ncbi:WYL domain-containing protein [Paenibacillus sp. FSL R7-0048]|uniref:helix-turn-helix transcriptional regulator n=1 Tax=Paenibacillus TaxID=44249 RepID=UPI00096BFB9B|nr:WYL domain-containing protein [Paenibacillus odorifer]OMD74311.1 hypothetical protein BSK48_00345 [Paenibacillus odorifer]
MRVDRLLSMLLIISGKGTVTGKELAEHFEVSLRMKNLHGLFGRNEAFNDIMLKVEHTYKRESDKHKLTLDMCHFSMEQENKEYIGIISKAITDNRLLVFDYINRDMEKLERTVEPSWIDFRHGHWYVIGFCRVREDYRRFKLVRIRQLRQGPPFAKRELPEDQIAEVIKQSYSQRDIQVVLRFTSRIGVQLTEYFEKEKISRGEDGSTTLQLYYDRNVYKVKFIYIDPFTQEEKLINEETYRFGVQFTIPSKSVWGLGVTGIGWKALDGAPEIDEYAMNLVPAQNVTYELILPDEGSGEGGEGENPGFPGSQFPGLTGFIKF